MNLLAVNLSAHPSDIHKFLQKLQMLSWSRGDQLQGQDVLRTWHRFAISRNDLLAFLILTFLHGMYRNDCLCSGLYAARSVWSSSITIKGYLKLSDHPLVSRYLKDIYNRHPPLPKYVDIWYLTLLLKYYEQKEYNDCLEFKELVKKTNIIHYSWSTYKTGSIYIKCWQYCF